MDDFYQREVIAERARKICVAYGIDPDLIIDEYGPVRNADLAHYHVAEVVGLILERLSEVESECDGLRKDVYGMNAALTAIVEETTSVSRTLDNYEMCIQSVNHHARSKLISLSDDDYDHND